ncbi:MAG: HAD family phosphatase [Deltaproteobacteria bacterium]|nr:HAD family phosphatase [Deltaproteobacteria bacterium]MBW2052549.1 HAD family phosphatase [Deltaproteobacteria bacterium]MBW2139606.1 HAD family phosphatase [Deltaproteobacteria bacterium]MBW2323246.1 HAD family phosphatase [Deltaproteobacteria bacterium]
MIVTNSVPGAGWSGRSRPRGMFITDFDGTLRRSDRGFSAKDLEALEELGTAGVVRVIATGRSLASLRRDVKRELPVDYIIFSSGAGVIKTSEWTLVREVSLSPDEVSLAADLLIKAGHDFMIHKPVPDSHIFAYHSTGEEADTDFERRLSFSIDHSWPLEGRHEDFGPAAQLVAIVPGSTGVPIYEGIREELSDFSVIRSTSPLDHNSVWVEIFPKNVSKSLAAKWLARELDVARRNTVSVGNDYNDQDVLEWAETSYVVSNSPEELKRRFQEVASNNHGGVAQAIKLWFSKGQPTGQVED